MEQFSLEAFHKLDTTIIIGKLCNNQMQNHIHNISKSNHPHNIPHAVPDSQIGNCNNSRPDTVSHDHADCFKCRKLCF